MARVPSLRQAASPAARSNESCTSPLSHSGRAAIVSTAHTRPVAASPPGSDGVATTKATMADPSADHSPGRASMPASNGTTWAVTVTGTKVPAGADTARVPPPGPGPAASTDRGTGVGTSADGSATARVGSPTTTPSPTLPLRQPAADRATTIRASAAVADRAANARRCHDAFTTVTAAGLRPGAHRTSLSRDPVIDRLASRGPPTCRPRLRAEHAGWAKCTGAAPAATTPMPTLTQSVQGAFARTRPIRPCP